VRSHEIKVSVSVGWDYPEYEAIIRRACAIKADLIVASQHAGRHRWRFFLKLTDWELVRLSPIPVLLVKNQNPYRHPAVLAAIDPAHSHRKPEMLDAAILRAAGEWSTALRGTLHAVHAYDRFPINMPPEALKSGALDDLQAQADQLAAKRFSHALTTARVARKRQYLIPASPVEAIGEAVRSSRSAILVMGVISRSGIKRLLIGNTAENLLDVLSCDILVIKPPTFRSGVPGRTSARARGLIAQDPPPRRGPPSRVHSV
jgi:universal stress protein E